MATSLVVNANNNDRPTNAHFHQITHKIVICKRNWILETKVRNTEIVASLSLPGQLFRKSVLLWHTIDFNLKKKDNWIYISLKYITGLMEKYYGSLIRTLGALRRVASLPLKSVPLTQCFRRS